MATDSILSRGWSGVFFFQKKWPKIICFKCFPFYWPNFVYSLAWQCQIWIVLWIFCLVMLFQAPLFTLKRRPPKNNARFLLFRDFFVALIFHNLPCPSPGHEPLDSGQSLKKTTGLFLSTRAKNHSKIHPGWNNQKKDIFTKCQKSFYNYFPQGRHK